MENKDDSPSHRQRSSSHGVSSADALPTMKVSNRGARRIEPERLAGGVSDPVELPGRSNELDTGANRRPLREFGGAARAHPKNTRAGMTNSQSIRGQNWCAGPDSNRGPAD